LVNREEQKSIKEKSEAANESDKIHRTAFCLVNEMKAGSKLYPMVVGEEWTAVRKSLIFLT